MCMRQCFGQQDCSKGHACHSLGNWFMEGNKGSACAAVMKGVIGQEALSWIVLVSKGKGLQPLMLVCKTISSSESSLYTAISPLASMSYSAERNQQLRASNSPQSASDSVHDLSRTILEWIYHTLLLACNILQVPHSRRTHHHSGLWLTVLRVPSRHPVPLMQRLCQQHPCCCARHQRTAHIHRHMILLTIVARRSALLEGDPVWRHGRPQPGPHSETAQSAFQPFMLRHDLTCNCSLKKGRRSPDNAAPRVKECAWAGTRSQAVMPLTDSLCLMSTHQLMKCLRQTASDD